MRRIKTAAACVAICWSCAAPDDASLFGRREDSANPSAAPEPGVAQGAAAEPSAERAPAAGSSVELDLGSSTREQQRPLPLVRPPRGPSDPDPGSEAPPLAGNEAGPGDPVPEGEAPAAAPRACPELTQPLLLAFAEAGENPSQGAFGDFDQSFSGGTFVYPDSPEPFGLSSNLSEGDWHIQATVGEPSGFGLYFHECQRIDASGYAGIAFSIAGDVGPTGALTFLVGTESNDVSTAWLVESGAEPEAEPDFGRCTPAATRFDGSCRSPRVSVPVTPAARQLRVLFTELAEGRPEAGVNPVEITSIGWSLPRPATAADGSPATYEVDVRIDDIRFIED